MQNKDPNLMSWDDAISDDGQEFLTLPEGDYTFTVTNFERGYHEASPKLPACSKASITVAIDNDQGYATCRFDLPLYRTLEWKLSAFLRCIGLKQKGEATNVDWNKIVNHRGKARFKPHTYVGNDGNEHTVNNLVRFYDYDSSVAYTDVTGSVDTPWGNGGF